MSDTQLLTVEEAASALRVVPVTVRRMIARGQLPAVRLGGRAGGLMRVRVSDLDDLLREWSRTPVAAESTA